MGFVCFVIMHASFPLKKVIDPCNYPAIGRVLGHSDVCGPRI